MYHCSQHFTPCSYFKNSSLAHFVSFLSFSSWRVQKGYLEAFQLEKKKNRKKKQKSVAREEVFEKFRSVERVKHEDAKVKTALYKVKQAKNSRL